MFNPKEIEVLAGDDRDGPFRSVAKCTLVNKLLLDARYQECTFPETTARFVQIKVLSSYHFDDWARISQIRLFGWLTP